MRKLALRFLLIGLIVILSPGINFASRLFTLNTNIDSLYQTLNFNIKPSYDLFKYGLTGYSRLHDENLLRNKRFLTLIDFTLSSTKRRLWVIDLHEMKVVQHSLVAHGKNTGEEFASKFSNIPQSNMSSIGFYVTGSTYYGKYGKSLYLDGIEQGFNDKARERTIVIHRANYATRDFITKVGRLGRSFGCPALPPNKALEIIDFIKDGSCLFIYYPDQNYLRKSEYLNDSDSLIF